MDELDFANDGQPQSSQRKRKAPNPSFRISKMSRKTAQTQEKTEQPETQMNRRQRKRATKKEVDLNDEAAGTSEKKILEMAEDLFADLLDLSTRVDIKALEHNAGKPIRTLDELSCFGNICIYILYYVYNIYCPYIYIYIYHINLINHVFFVAFTLAFTLNQVLAATAVG